MTRRALVVGAGIGGLAAALALARQGFGVDVFERAPALQEFGAGLQLTPNATRALARLGALAAVREIASAPSAVRVLRGADGAELARLPIAGAERRWGAPYLAVHRVDLHRTLAEAAAATGKVALNFGAEVAAVGPHVRTIRAGDTVLYNPEECFEVDVQGEEYLILRERDVHAIASERMDGGTGLYL